MRTARPDKTRLELRLLYALLAIAATAALPGLGSEVKTGIVTAAANLRAS